MNNNEYYFFYHNNEIYSQWYPSIFNIYNKNFVNAEQAMMYKKAILFNDMEIANKILENNDPKIIKSLGRKVKNFDETIWKNNREKIVYSINLAKFSQNTIFKQKLLETENQILVEASPYDRIWGIGYDKKTALENKSNWGLNLLGKCLMEVRKTLS